MFYGWTLVTDGRVLVVVAAIGSKTEIGEISESLAQATSIDTPLL